jgi:hypothetical protein
VYTLEEVLDGAHIEDMSNAGLIGSPEDFEDDDFEGSIMGDPFEEDELVAIEPEELAELVTGAPRMRRKIASRVSRSRRGRRGRTSRKGRGPSSSSSSLAKFAPVSQAPQPRITDSLLIPVIYVKNARLENSSVVQKVPGARLKTMMETAFITNPHPTIDMSQTGDSISSGEDIELSDVNGVAQLTDALTGIMVPILFIKISTSRDNVRGGARFGISVTGYNCAGQALDMGKFTVSRQNSTDEIFVAIIPHLRSHDKIVPTPAFIGYQATGVVASVAEVTLRKVTITITGGGANDTAYLVIPGPDSEDLREFAKVMGISI